MIWQYVIVAIIVSGAIAWAVVGIVTSFRKSKNKKGCNNDASLCPSCPLADHCKQQK